MSEWYPKHVRMMPNTCPNDAQNMFECCPKHVWMMPKTCLPDAQSMSEWCPKHVWMMTKTCLIDAQNMSETCMHGCMHGWMHAWMHGCKHGSMHASMHGSKHGYKHASIQASMKLRVSPPARSEAVNILFIFLTMRVKGINKIIIYNNFSPPARPKKIYPSTRTKRLLSATLIDSEKVDFRSFGV